MSIGAPSIALFEPHFAPDILTPIEDTGNGIDADNSLSAGISIGLFGLITAIGLTASAFFNEQPPNFSPEPSGILGPVAYDSSSPRIHLRIKPDRYGAHHPLSRGAIDTFERPAFEGAAMPEVSERANAASMPSRLI